MTAKAELKQGLDLDVLIAEKIMGWSWQEIDFFWNKGGELYLVPIDDPHAFDRTTSGAWNWLDDNPRRRVLFDLPQYSGDVAAAFQVVEKIATPGFEVRINASGAGTFDVSWWLSDFGEGQGECLAEVTDCGSLPFAICLAALQESR